jgi:hypothetical protein
LFIAPEYRSNARVLLSDTPLNDMGKNLSLEQTIQAQNDFLRSDQFATLFITHYKIANVQGSTRRPGRKSCADGTSV